MQHRILTTLAATAAIYTAGALGPAVPAQAHTPAAERVTLRADAGHVVRWQTHRRYPSRATVAIDTWVDGHALTFTEYVQHADCHMRVYGREAVVAFDSCRNGSPIRVRALALTPARIRIKITEVAS